MSKIENLKCEMRIDRAVRKTVPRNVFAEAGGVALSCANEVWFLPNLSVKFYTYRARVEQERKALKKTINAEHPEWHQKAPKVKEIVNFLAR